MEGGTNREGRDKAVSEKDGEATQPKQSQTCLKRET